MLGSTARDAYAENAIMQGLCGLWTPIPSCLSGPVLCVVFVDVLFSSHRTAQLQATLSM